MKKTLFILFASIAMVAGAQTTGNTSASPRDSASVKAHKHQGHQGRKAGQWGLGNNAQGRQRMAFLKDLSEADKATVKEVMGQYHKECKAVMEKYKTQRPAKGVKPTEEQMDAMFKARTASRIEVLKLQEKYYDTLRKTLKPWQAATMLDMNREQANRPQRQQRPGGKARP